MHVSRIRLIRLPKKARGGKRTLKMPSARRRSIARQHDPITVQRGEVNER